MFPVSSLTVRAMASVRSEIPAAARWRKPNWEGSSLLSLKGSMAPAADTVFPVIIVAPS